MRCVHPAQAEAVQGVLFVRVRQRAAVRLRRLRDVIDAVVRHGMVSVGHTVSQPVQGHVVVHGGGMVHGRRAGHVQGRHTR